MKLLSTPQMPLSPSSGPTQPGFSHSIPRCFSSLEEAQNSLYFHRNQCLRAASGLMSSAAYGKAVLMPSEPDFIDSHLKAYRVLQDTFTKWASAFRAFLDSYSETLDSKSLLGAAVLKINLLITTLNLKSLNVPTSDGSWDEDVQTCEEIVNLASTVIQMQNTCSRALSEKAPIFSFDVSTTAPLYTIIHRCRDPSMRRKAIALLYSAPRQEGLWNSIATARACEKIMLVEEAGLGEVKSCKDIPNSNRVTEVDVQFDMQGRRGYLTLVRRLDLEKETGSATQTSHELIEW